MSIWQPRFHGNGFLQVYLDGCTRLHIWTPELEEYKRVSNAQIHDHRFIFESTVLMGKLEHEEFDVTQTANGIHGLWQQGPGLSCAKAGPLEKICHCNLMSKDLLSFKAGDEYEYGGPKRFHQTTGIGLTVTVMRKVKFYDEYRAQIVCLGDGEVDHAFETQPPMELMQDVALRVMRLLVTGEE